MITKIKTREWYSFLRRLREMDSEPGGDSIEGARLNEIRRSILAKLRLRVARRRSGSS